jgi:hypothetical protein
MSADDIILGAEYRDRVSCFVGIAVAKTSYIWACVRVSLQAQGLHEGKPGEWQAFDRHSLEYVGPGISESLAREAETGQGDAAGLLRDGGPGETAALPSTPRRERAGDPR